MWKDDICERLGLQFTNSIWRPFFNVAEMLQSDCLVILWSADVLFTSPTKTEERYIAKETNREESTQSFTQKVILAFAFDTSIHLLVEAL